MKKTDSLRAAITAVFPRLQDDPDRMLVFIDQGSITSTNSDSLSFEWTYTAVLLLTDFTGDSDALMGTILAWAKHHQPDLLQNRDNAQTGITFEADLLNHGAVDLTIRIRLVARAVATRHDDGRTTWRHVDDSVPANLNWDAMGFVQPRDTTTGATPIEAHRE